jgi:hypothetical protein
VVFVSLFPVARQTPRRLRAHGLVVGDAGEVVDLRLLRLDVPARVRPLAQVGREPARPSKDPLVSGFGVIFRVGYDQGPKQGGREGV